MTTLDPKALEAVKRAAFAAYHGDRWTEPGLAYEAMASSPIEGADFEARWERVVRAVLSARSPEAVTEEALEAASRAIYEARHKGLRNCYDWDDSDLDDAYPGIRERYLRDARAALTAALPCLRHLPPAD